MRIFPFILLFLSSAQVVWSNTTHKDSAKKAVSFYDGSEESLTTHLFTNANEEHYIPATSVGKIKLYTTFINAIDEGTDVPSSALDKWNKLPLQQKNTFIKSILNQSEVLSSYKSFWQNIIQISNFADMPFKHLNRFKHIMDLAKSVTVEDFEDTLTIATPVFDLNANADTALNNIKDAFAQQMQTVLNTQQAVYYGERGKQLLLRALETYTEQLTNQLQSLPQNIETYLKIFLLNPDQVSLFSAGIPFIQLPSSSQRGIDSFLYINEEGDPSGALQATLELLESVYLAWLYEDQHLLEVFYDNFFHNTNVYFPDKIYPFAALPSHIHKCRDIYANLLSLYLDINGEEGGDRSQEPLIQDTTTFFLDCARKAGLP